MQYHGWQGLIRTLAKNTIKQQIELSNTYIVQGVKQSTIEETIKDKTIEEIVEEEIKKYIIKDKTIVLRVSISRDNI